MLLCRIQTAGAVISGPEHLAGPVFLICSSFLFFFFFIFRPLRLVSLTHSHSLPITNSSSNKRKKKEEERKNNNPRSGSTACASCWHENTQRRLLKSYLAKRSSVHKGQTKKKEKNLLSECVKPRRRSLVLVYRLENLTLIGARLLAPA